MPLVKKRVNEMNISEPIVEQEFILARKSIFLHYYEADKFLLKRLKKLKILTLLQPHYGESVVLVEPTDSSAMKGGRSNNGEQHLDSLWLTVIRTISFNSENMYNLQKFLIVLRCIYSEENKRMHKIKADNTSMGSLLPSKANPTQAQTLEYFH